MKTIIFSMIFSALFIACNNDSGRNGSGNGTYTHNQLAERFMYELNLNSDYGIELIKKSTKTSNFIVVFDPAYNSYDAIDISGWNVNMDAVDYFNNPSTVFYYDLDVVPGYETTSGYVKTYYRDRNSGLSFEKGNMTPKDLAKVAALTEAITISKSAEFLSSEFGLSLERSTEIAKLSSHWRKASKKGMTNLELDSFSTEILGFSISQGKEAFRQSILRGDDSSLNELVNKAADTNEISPEHVQKLMSKVFGL